MPEKKIILSIDDETHFTKLLKLNLEAEGEYTVLTAASGEEGLEVIRGTRPDLVLLDMMMPGIDGIETLKRIKAIDPEIPVALVTAVWDEVEGKKAFDAGAYEYITKPIDLDYLKKAVLVKLF